MRLSDQLPNPSVWTPPLYSRKAHLLASSIVLISLYYLSWALVNGVIGGGLLAWNSYSLGFLAGLMCSLRSLLNTSALAGGGL